jgi:beta-galactosidase GanA
MERKEKAMSTWTVSGTQIEKDGQSVFLAGVCYAPTPAGAATYTPGIGDWFAPPWNGIWERDFALMKGMGINNLRTYFFCNWSGPRGDRVAGVICGSSEA